MPFLSSRNISLLLTQYYSQGIFSQSGKSMDLAYRSPLTTEVPSACRTLPPQEVSGDKCFVLCAWHSLTVFLGVPFIASGDRILRKVDPVTP